MPTVRMMDIPPPTDWSEFEEITRDALAILWDSPELQRNGRQGQSQHGVDVYGADNWEEHVGVQCKRIEDQISLNMVNEEIAKAENFEPPIARFIVATTTPSDAKLQKEIRLLSRKRVSQGKFPITIMFWADIFREIAKSDAALKNHYPQLAGQFKDENDKFSPDLSLFDIAFFGRRVEHYVGLIFGAIGMYLAQEDPYQILVITEMVTACAARVMDQAGSDKVKLSLIEMGELCLRNVNSKAENDERWQHVHRLAKLVEQLVANIEYSLSGRELGIFKLGRFLGNWDSTTSSDDNLGDNDQKALYGLVDAVVADKTTIARIEPIVAEHNESDSVMKCQTANRVYGIVRSALETMIIIPIGTTEADNE